VSILDLDIVKPHVRLLKSLVGSNKMCYLINCFDYSLDFVYIIEKKGSYRLVIKYLGQIVKDRRCTTLKGARNAFSQFNVHHCCQTGKIKSRWSDFFCPDDTFFIHQVEAIRQFHRQTEFDQLSESKTAVDFLNRITGQYGTILADPPWRFMNRTGKGAPEHKRLNHYPTLSVAEIAHLPVSQVSAPRSHLYLWVPNALVLEGLLVMKSWGFTYKTNLVWYKIRKDGGPDRRGVGFYFRNVTEMVLFGIKGSLRTLSQGRRQENIILSPKSRHSQKPESIYHLIEQCSPSPYLELFARTPRPTWTQWGKESPSQIKN
jgi:N6-adenosine-specific RNA methylase IME4